MEWRSGRWAAARAVVGGYVVAGTVLAGPALGGLGCSATGNDDAAMGGDESGDTGTNSPGPSGAEETSATPPGDEPPAEETGTTGPGEPDGPPDCAMAGLDSENAVGVEELRELMDRTQAAVDDSAYAGLVHVIDGEVLLEMTGYFYCVQLSFRFDWLERTAVTCIEHHDVESTISVMDTRIAEWPEIPEAIASLDELEAALSECHPEFSPAYEPCGGVTAGEWFSLENRIEDPGGCYDADWVEVDVVTAETLQCFVEGEDCATTG